MTLASLRGQAVAVTFIYTRCPLPDYCPRMLANFKEVRARFRDRLGKDLTLLVVTFDPQYDTVERSTPTPARTTPTCRAGFS